MYDYHPSADELAAALGEANRILRGGELTDEARERIKTRVMARVERDRQMNPVSKFLNDHPAVRTALVGLIVAIGGALIEALTAVVQHTGGALP